MAHEQIIRSADFNYTGTAYSLIGVSNDGITCTNYTILASDNSIVIVKGSGIFISALTNAGGVGSTYAATGNTYIVTDLSTDLTNEFRLVQSGNSITINTAGNNIIINAVTNGGGGGAVARSVTFMSQTSAVWTNMPSAFTEFMGNFQFRNLFDMTGVTSVNLSATVTTVGSAVTALYLMWSTNGGTTFDNVGNVGSSPTVNIGVAGIRTSGWAFLNTKLTGECILAVWGSDGNLALDPRFGNVSALFK